MFSKAGNLWGRQGRRPLQALVDGRRARAVSLNGAHGGARREPQRHHPRAWKDHGGFVATGVSRSDFLQRRNDRNLQRRNGRNQNSIATASHTRTTGKRNPATRTALLDFCFLFLRRACFTQRTVPKTHTRH